MESSTQINIRMDRSLKEAGDAALAQIGLNPSQAVRALWEKASHRGKDLEEVSARELDACRRHAGFAWHGLYAYQRFAR